MSRTMRASICASCRFSMPSSFPAMVGIRSSATRSPTIQLPRCGQQARQSSDITLNNQASQIQVTRTSSNSSPREDIDGQHPNSEPLSVPWYLQVDTPSVSSYPISKRQEIPDLPESSPDILEPLLNQISIDLGLDDLSILDLRNINPPSALGANLIMIFGTARSEKHLHVSADRLCRWLRSTYKLRPVADGLLGRNELKLKIKRKARRAKLIGNGTPEEEADDGIRTGWVCINVGTVESKVEPKESLRPKDYIGFGSPMEGVKVVVQMLTEGKRAEIDLEQLWNQILEQQVRQDAEKIIGGDTHDVARTEARPSLITKSRPLTQISFQSRGIHTSAGHCTTFSHPLREIPGLPTRKDVEPKNYETLQPAFSQAIWSGNFGLARFILLNNHDSIIELQGDGWRSYMLQGLRQYLESLPPSEARQNLGESWHDRSSTPFLLAFYSALSTFPTQDIDWESQIWLHSFARKVKHPDWSLSGIEAIFQSIQLSGISLPVQAWLELLRAALTSPECTEAGLTLTEKLDLAMQILRYMENCGEEIITQEVFVTLFESICPSIEDDTSRTLSVPNDSAHKTFGLPVAETSPLQKRLVTLMFQMHIPFTLDVWQIRVLKAFARQSDWESFWKFWRTLARRGLPRSAALYACMFHLVADVKHQKACMTVLRNWVPEMELESPTIPIHGDVAGGIEACLRVIDPAIAQGKLDRRTGGEWLDLWSRCKVSSLQT